MKKRRSEIATLFVIGTMVVVGVTAIVSSLTLNQKKTTSSRASTYSCETNGNKCVFKDDIMNPLTVCQENGYTTTAVGSCATNYVCCKKNSTPASTNTPTPKTIGVCDEVKCSTINSAYTKGSYFVKDEDPSAYSSGCKTKLTSSQSVYCKNLNPVNTATPVPPSGKGCGSGGGWECDVSKGYDTQSCPVANKEFRCCVQRSNGELVVYGCGGTHCSAINLSGITACSTQAGYGSGAPGSLITKPGQANPTEPPAGGGGGGAGGPIDPNCKAGSGNRFECDPSAGYNTAVCTESNMEFACCVQDTRCPSGEARYRWYGCTGQPCQNTKIGNAIGHLVACPYGVDKSNQESCESALPPTPTFPPAEEPEEPPSQTGECFAAMNNADCMDETAVTGVRYQFNRTTKQCCPLQAAVETPSPAEPENTPTPLPRLTIPTCEEVDCPSPKTGTYARVKPLLSTQYVYYSSLDQCGRFGLNGRTENAVKAEVCKDPPRVQGPLPIITISIPPINFQQPFQLTLPPLTQITPGQQILINTNVVLQCHPPNVNQTVINNFMTNVSTGRSSFTICAENEDIVMLPSNSGSAINFQCCPKN